MSYLLQKELIKERCDHHSSSSAQTKRDEQRHIQKRKNGFEKKDGISKENGGIIKDEARTHNELLHHPSQASSTKTSRI